MAKILKRSSAPTPPPAKPVVSTKAKKAAAIETTAVEVTEEKKVTKPRPTPAKTINIPPPTLDAPGTGPWPLREGEGMIELQSWSPERPLTLDDGVFMWLWRIVEAKALGHQKNVNASPAHKAQYEVARRAAIAFRRAAGHIDEEPTKVEEAPRKRLIRKTS